MNSGKNPRVVVGIILVLLGTAFMLRNVGVIEHVHFWHFWPLILIVMGLVKLLQPDHGRGRWDGLWLVLLGAWFQMVTLHIYGLTFWNSWSVVLIIWGLIHVGRALTGQPHVTFAEENTNGH